MRKREKKKDRQKRENRKKRKVKWLTVLDKKKNAY